ncbi:MAG: hypothetical protein EBE86_008015 [Hormoscilla sp. GUM202]|nr:hypothetical protein [Hormoscilla sp. GUM202]
MSSDIRDVFSQFQALVIDLRSPIFRSFLGAPTLLCRFLRTTSVGAPETKVRGPIAGLGFSQVTIDDDANEGGDNHAAMTLDMIVSRDAYPGGGRSRTRWSNLQLTIYKSETHPNAQLFFSTPRASVH